MLPHEVRTLKHFVAYCYEVLSLKPQYMREKEQEPLAGHIVGLYGNDHLKKLEEKHYQITKILDTAAELEISNVDNTTLAWRYIKELVEELDQLVSK